MEDAGFKYVSMSVHDLLRLWNDSRQEFVEAGAKSRYYRERSGYAAALGRSVDDYDRWRQSWQDSRANELAIICHRHTNDYGGCSSLVDQVKKILQNPCLLNVPFSDVKSASLRVIKLNDDNDNWFLAERSINEAQRELADRRGCVVVLPVPSGYQGVTADELRPGHMFRIDVVPELLVQKYG
jgi:hypothetical protein